MMADVTSEGKGKRQKGMSWVEGNVRVQGLSTVGAESAVLGGSSKGVLAKDNLLAGREGEWSEILLFDA
jgi:hypothetical protein